MVHGQPLKSAEIRKFYPVGNGRPTGVYDREAHQLLL